MGGKLTLNALYDFLSFIEIADNSYEFEWRIVGDHELFKKTNQKEKRICFGLNDIMGLYVSSEKEKFYVKKWLEDKISKGDIKGKIPPIYQYEEILLTSKEIDLMNKLLTRKS